MEKLKEIPAARAIIKGSETYPDIKGKADFYDVHGGTVLVVEVTGLPGKIKDENSGFFGFHIHEGSSCTGNGEDPFADTGGHYNPGQGSHPKHAGDLPPFLADHGSAWMSVYTTRFFPEDVVGRTIVIHSMPDDFRTQPSGNSGEKIACGLIVPGEREMP